MPKVPSQKTWICTFLRASLRLLFAVFALIIQWNNALGLDLGHCHSAKVLQILKFELAWDFVPGKLMEQLRSGRESSLWISRWRLFVAFFLGPYWMELLGVAFLTLSIFVPGQWIVDVGFGLLIAGTIVSGVSCIHQKFADWRSMKRPDEEGG